MRIDRIAFLIDYNLSYSLFTVHISIQKWLLIFSAFPGNFKTVSTLILNIIKPNNPISTGIKI